LLKAVCKVVIQPSTCDYYNIKDLGRGFIPAEWRALVGDRGTDDPRSFNRRHLEPLAILEAAEAIKAGAVHVSGSLSYDDFWGKLPTEAGDPQRIAAYVTERGWPAGAAGFTGYLREKLENEAWYLDTDVGVLRSVQLDKNRRPIVPRIIARELPVSAAQAARQVLEEMPERSVLEALANTAQWANWPRHFGLPSGLGSGIENVHDRYLITTFAYGCGLGPAQAARHFGGAFTAEDLSFLDRRHVDIADLRAGSADLQNLYSQFELTKLWGTGESAAADGTHFETFRNNLLAAHHFRYGKTGGIAYRHISDNYIALFSGFIGCGIYEATYILDILQNTMSDLRPSRLHADSHGQSAHVFGPAFLLGIELMPRIRGWKRLKLYRPGGSEQLSSSIPSITCSRQQSIGAGSRNTIPPSCDSRSRSTVASSHPRPCLRESKATAAAIPSPWRFKNWDTPYARRSCYAGFGTGVCAAKCTKGRRRLSAATSSRNS
jgi:hypothetical protein